MHESQTANKKPGNMKLYAPFNARTLIGRKLVGISKKREKERIKQKIENVWIGYSDKVMEIKLIKF